jgi:hypothetical protein
MQFPISHFLPVLVFGCPFTVGWFYWLAEALKTRLMYRHGLIRDDDWEEFGEALRERIPAGSDRLSKNSLR